MVETAADSDAIRDQQRFCGPNPGYGNSQCRGQQSYRHRIGKTGRTIRPRTGKEKESARSHRVRPRPSKAGAPNPRNCRRERTASALLSTEPALPFDIRRWSRPLPWVSGDETVGETAARVAVVPGVSSHGDCGSRMDGVNSVLAALRGKAGRIRLGEHGPCPRGGRGRGVRSLYGGRALTVVNRLSVTRHENALSAHLVQLE